jgi:hypothetical protein
MHIPKMESTTRSVSLSAEGKSSVKGIFRSFNCFVRRCRISQYLNVNLESDLMYLVELILALLGVVYCRVITIMGEMASCYQTITT